MQDLAISGTRRVGGTLPAARPEEVVRRAAADVAGLVRSIREMFKTGTVVPDLATGQELLDRCSEYQPALLKIQSDLDELARPANRKELVDALDILVESVSAFMKGDKKIFGRMLTEDVGAQQPTIGALIATCRVMRRTCKTELKIAVVIETLANEEYNLSFERAAVRETFEFERKRLSTAVDEERRALQKRAQLTSSSQSI